MYIFRKKPFLIGDIGVNYYEIAEKEEISLLDAAKLMILEAKKCGLDAVKFQSYKAENIVSRKASDFDDESSISLFDLFKKYDKFGYEEFRQLADYCSEIGIMFLSTPLDIESADYLEEFMDIYPIASSDLTNIP
ncbi:MAG: N-acetylneuraminate synthase family protein, partial [Methanobrevibacter sp.]|nr:N-acetylneuraminate synthase family protein [Methanobrevibacter sp.]